jgi:predicted TIM-barrel fold metal-dependent hydrolase
VAVYSGPVIDAHVHLQLDELERVAAAGARGLKLHPNTQDFDVADGRVAALVGKAGELDLPVLFDAYSPFDADQPGKFVKLAMEAKESKIILAHMHGPRFLELLVYQNLALYPWWAANVWHDVSWAAADLGRFAVRRAVQLGLPTGWGRPVAVRLRLPDAPSDQGAAESRQARLQ